MLFAPPPTGCTLITTPIFTSLPHFDFEPSPFLQDPCQLDFHFIYAWNHLVPTILTWEEHLSEGLSRSD